MPILVRRYPAPGYRFHGVVGPITRYLNTAGARTRAHAIAMALDRAE